MAKVVINEYDIIILDDSVDGKRHRLTTGKKQSKRLVDWYTAHFKEEFTRLYNKKFDVVQDKLITFKEYGSLVLEITKKNRNQFSQKEELQRFKRLCSFFGDMDIALIRASNIMKWQNDINLAPKTIINYRGTLNIVLHMAYCDELINRNPLTMVKAPKKIKKEVEIFTEEEIKLLIDKADGQFKNILQFNFFQGLRGSELIALRWSDIDFKSNTVTIDTRIREGNEDVTKSKEVRVIDLLPQAKEALLKQQRLTALKSDFIFLTQYSKSYRTPDGITVMLKSLCRELKIKERTLHVVRKTCNTMYKQYNMNNDWILHQLGHIDDDVNRHHYTGKIKPDLSEIGRVLAG